MDPVIFVRRTILILIVSFVVSHTFGQQFNSDSYLSKKHGVITIIPTYGQRNTMLMTTYSLFPRWEFTVAAYIYNNDKSLATNDGYSTSLYAKYMFYENDSKTGGFAVKLGTGLFPGNIEGEEKLNDAFKTFWMNAPATIPLFNNKLQIDLMPGASMTVDYGSKNMTAWGLTYSTRAAWYPFGDKGALVGEIFGMTGAARAPTEYKAGVRWEPSPYAVFAITYGQEFNGNNGAGFEVGIMLFTPAFACFKGCGAPKESNKKWFNRISH